MKRSFLYCLLYSWRACSIAALNFYPRGSGDIVKVRKEIMEEVGKYQVLNLSNYDKNKFIDPWYSI